MKPTYRIRYEINGDLLLSGLREKEDAEVLAEFMLMTGVADNAEVYQDESEVKDENNTNINYIK